MAGKKLTVADGEFTPQVMNDGEPGKERFQVWVRGVCVARDDHECYVNVYVDGALVYSLEAEIQYEEGGPYGERPMPNGFMVKQRKADLHGQNPTHDKPRLWKRIMDTETDENL